MDGAVEAMGGIEDAQEEAAQAGQTCPGGAAGGAAAETAAAAAALNGGQNQKVDMRHRPKALSKEYTICQLRY